MYSFYIVHTSLGFRVVHYLVFYWLLRSIATDCQCKIYHLVVHRDPDVIHTSSNEAYLAVKQTRGTGADPADYETPLSVHPSFQLPAGDSLYEPV